MRPLLKKSISIALVFALSAPALQARDLWQSLDVGQLHDSTTGFQKFTGANGEAVYNVGGTLTLKRDTQNYPLWWNFQPPGIKASCSGISFKGMFGSIVNLDEIATQFEEAGASFAWGILVGVIYSLPGIGEIFTKLDAWAKKIQAMLADSCNAGIAIGKEFGSRAMDDASSELEGSFNSETYIKAETWMKDKTEMVSNFLDCNSAVWANMGSEVDCEDGKITIKAKLGGSYLATPSLIVSTLLNIYQKNGTWPGLLTDGETGSITWNNTNVNTADGREIATAALITSVVGDVVVSRDHARDILNFIDIMDNDTINAKTKKEQLGNAENAIAATRDNPEIIMGSLSMEEAASFLIYGNSTELTPLDGNTSGSTASTINSTHVLQSIKLPRIDYYVQEKVGAQNGNLSAMAVKDLFSNSDTSKPIHTSITKHITEYKGISILAQEIKECYLDGIATQCAAAQSSMVDDDQARYFAKVYRNTASIPDKVELSRLYLKYTQYQMAYAIYYKLVEYIGLIADEVKESTQKDYANSDSLKDLQNVSVDTTAAKKIVLENLNTFKHEYREVLQKAFPEADINLNEISKKFKEQDKENIRKAYGKNA